MSSIDKELADPEVTFEGRLATFVATRGIPALSEDQIKAVKRRIDFFESAIALLSARLKGGANTEQAFKQLDTYIRHDYFKESDTANMTAAQLASANRFIQFIIRKQAEGLKGIYTPIVISPEMKRWMGNGIIPADNAIPSRAPAAIEFGSDTIPVALLESDPYSVDALRNQLKETAQKIENDSPIILQLFIEEDLNPTLAKLAAKIESLTTPDMTAEALSLKAGHLIDHVQSLEELKNVAQAKIAKALNLKEGEIAPYPEIEYFVIGGDAYDEAPMPKPGVIDLENLPVLTDVITDPIQMKKIIQQSVKIQKAVETLTGDDLFQLRKNVIGPLYQEALTEIDAKRNHQTAIPHLSRIEPEDLLKHADFLEGQLNIASTKIQVETVLKAKAQDVRVITDAVIITPAKAAAPALPEDREIDLTSRLSGWIRKSWSKASNSVRAVVAGTIGLGVASLATAFALSAKNAPEAPEAPIASPVAVTAVTSAPIITAPVAPIAVAEPVSIEDVKGAAPEPVKAKPVHLAKKSFAPAVTVVNNEPIIEKSFDIAEFGPDLASLIKACKQAGEVKVGSVCESIKSYEIK